MRVLRVVDLPPGFSRVPGLEDRPEADLMEPKIEPIAVREEPRDQCLPRGRRILSDVVGIDGRRARAVGMLLHLCANLDFCRFVEVEPFRFMRL
jgi:hypothetical protein